jgi:hypothetical protein
MALKGYLIIDPECSQICDDAIKAMKDQIGAQEVEVLEVAEAIRRGIDLGEPEGVPFVCIHSETSQKCLTKMYFHDEEGKVVIQPYPSVHEPEKEISETEQG